MNKASVDPFRIERTGDDWRVQLLMGPDLSPEIPPDYDLHLAERFADVLTATAPALQVDLAGHHAISSRQLGVLIALQRALRPKFAQLRLSHVAPPVVRLLDVTRTRQFFEILAS